jgi:hypothetical protein
MYFPKGPATVAEVQLFMPTVQPGAVEMEAKSEPPEEAE